MGATYTDALRAIDTALAPLVAALGSTLRCINECTPVLNAIGGSDLEQVGITEDDFDHATDLIPEAQTLAYQALAQAKGGAQ